MNIEPGTLCLITKGRSTGQSTIAIRPVNPSEIAALLSKHFDIPDVCFDYQGSMWEIDTPLKWELHFNGRITEIPYAPASSLLPIPPLADPLDITQSNELELKS